MEKDKRYAEIITHRYKKAQELAQEVFDRVELNRNLYKGILLVDDTYEWDYSLVDQQVFPLVRNYIARSNPSMTKVRLEGRDEKDIERRQINQDFVNWEINELPLTTLLTRAFYSNYLAGKAYFKTGWKYDPRIQVKRGEIFYTMRELTNRADLKFVRFNNILIPNRNIPDLQEQPYILELMQLSPGEMMKDNESYGYEYWDESFIDWLRKNGVTSKALDYEAEFVKDAETIVDKDKKDDPIEMAFRAATFPVVCMHTKENEVFYMPLIDDVERIINKERENEFWHGHYPYLDMTAFPEDDEFYSMSVVDAVGDTQIASTEVLNQTLTNIRSINNNMWITGAPAATTPDYMFKQRPSGIIRVAGDPGQVVPVRPQDGTRSMLEVGRELQTKFERTGGISSLYSSGAPSKTINQTARGAQIIDQNIETNVAMIMDLFGEQVLKPLGDHFIALNAQYVTEEQTFAVTGKKGVRELLTISPELVSANFDVFTYPESMIKQTPASRQASLQNFLTILNTQVVPTGAQVDVIPVVEALVDSYPEMENIEDIVVSVDEKGRRDIKMLERGQFPEVKVRDAHLELIQLATIHFEENAQAYPPEVQQLFTLYVEKHMRFIQSAQEVQQLTAPAQPQVPGADALAQAFGANPENGEIPETVGTGEEQGYNLGAIV
jgi:hypothetical protein